MAVSPVTINVSPFIVAGSSVSAYPGSIVDVGPPPGSPLETVTASPSGNVTFLTLTESRQFYAVGLSPAGLWEYVQFTTPTVSGVGGGGGIGPTGPPGPPGPPGSGTADYIRVTDTPYSADNTGATNAFTQIQAALDAANTAGGGDVFIPDGTYKMALNVTESFTTPGNASSARSLRIYSNTRLRFGPKAVLDFSAMPSGGVLTVLLGLGAQAGRGVSGFSDLTANAVQGDNTITVVDGSQFAPNDQIKLGSYAFWDPGQRNQWVGEICDVELVTGNVLTLRQPVLHPIYYAGTPINPSPSTLTTAMDTVQTTLTVSDASGYAQPEQNKAGTLLIETEQVSYNARDGRTFYGCVRGVAGTTAATHAIGVTVTEVPFQTTLNGALTNSATTVALTSTAGMPLKGGIVVDSEAMYYNSYSGNVLSSVVRGTGGTTAASHLTGAAAMESDVGFVAKITPVKNVTVEGGTFKGPNFDQADNNVYTGMVFWWGRNIKIRSTKFENCKTRGIELYDCVDALVDGISNVGSDRNNFGYPVAILFACQDCRIVNNYMEQCRHGVTHGGGIDTHGVSRRIIVANNTVINATSAAFDCHSGAGGTTFIGNTAYDTGGSGGFNINCPVTSVIGNRIRKVSAHGINLQNVTVQPTRWMVANNVFEDVSASGIAVTCGNASVYPTVGLEIEAIQITGNYINRTAQHGIQVIGGVTGSGVVTRFPGVVIANNTVRRVNTNSYYGIGITNLDNGVVQGNTLSNQAIDGIQVVGCIGTVINGNNISYRRVPGSTISGIDVLASTPASSDLIITANKVSLGYTGLKLDNTATYCLVQGNNFRGCTVPMSLGTGAGHISTTADASGAYNRI